MMQNTALVQSGAWKYNIGYAFRGRGGRHKYMMRELLRRAPRRRGARPRAPHPRHAEARAVRLVFNKIV